MRKSTTLNSHAHMFKVHKTEVVTIAQRLEHTTESVNQVWFTKFAHGNFQANFLKRP